MDMFYGIDPGKGGAIALIYGREAFVFDTPVARDDKKTRYLIASMREKLVMGKLADRKFAFLELAHAMPKQGVTSMFAFGEGYGIWQGLLGGLQIPFELVTPQAWKKEMMAGRPKGKSAARIRAQELFPELEPELRLVKHDGRADSLLIAEYGRRKAP